jgi:uncharacterized repeat protein (TIGR03806 family)
VTGLRQRIIYSLVLAGMIGCSRTPRGVQAHLDDHYPDKLSEWQIFTGSQRELKPNTGVLVYTVNTALFSNHAAKLRTVWMPKGSSATYKPEGVFDLPVGSVLTKTFSFANRHIETRLYVHKKNGWQGITYVWNHDQSDAVLDVTPAPVAVNWNGQVFDYDIPNVNQCKVCHEGPADNGPLGITARQLNRDNQLALWTQAGYLKGAPAALAEPPSDLNSRARAYLDVNCASCHIVGGRAMKSGVFLAYSEPAPKSPAKLLETMLSTDPKKMMPTIGRTLIDDEGVALIRDWVQSQSQ